MPSEQIRTHLISMYCVLSKATIAVVGNSPTKEEKQLKAQIATLYHQNKVTFKLFHVMKLSLINSIFEGTRSPPASKSSKDY